MQNGGNATQAMLDAGYSPATAHNPQKLTNSIAFKEVIGMVDDAELIAKVREIALDDDKRASLQAIDMLLKLKDRYPAGKLKVQEYNEELASLTE